MKQTHWTSPAAYLGATQDDLERLIADVGSRHLFRSMNEVAVLLDQAHAATLSTAVRTRIEAAMSAMTSSIGTHNALRRVLSSNGTIQIADTLAELCEVVSYSPGAGGVPVVLDLEGDAAIAWAEPATAWALAAAIVEMLQEVSVGGPIRVTAKLHAGELAIVATSDVSSCVAKPVLDVSRRHFLRKLAKSLRARLVRCRPSGTISLGLVISTKRSDVGQGAG